MSVLDGLFHALNFVAPAFVLGFFLAFCGLSLTSALSVQALYRQTIFNVVVCVMALIAGLVWFGRDGKMATYAAMVLNCASCQLLLPKYLAKSNRPGR